MQISFFEEFPTKENLAKLKLVTGPTKLYLAAPNLAEFELIRSTLQGQKVKDTIYWPILTKKEGYWISPFSSRKALKRIFRELAGKKVSVMLDLELPTRQNSWLYLTQSFHFCGNKKLIGDFIAGHKGHIYLAEYYPEGRKQEGLLERLGLHYQSGKVKVIKMLYHSLHPFSEDFVRQELRYGKQEYGKNFLVAYGTMGTGVHQTEQNIEPKQLKKDLRLARKAGISEVVLYRLGGLNKEYGKVVKYCERPTTGHIKSLRS